MKRNLINLIYSSIIRTSLHINKNFTKCLKKKNHQECAFSEYFEKNELSV